MNLTQITPPAAEPITVDQLKGHARITTNDEDSLIESYISTARQKLDGRDGWLGRALVEQQWRLDLDGFVPEIVVPLPPCRLVDSITYVDADGETQTLDASAYRISGLNTVLQARIVPVTSWPAAKAQHDSVSVSFTAGYTTIPEPILQAIRMWAAHLYDERHATVMTSSMKEMPLGIEELIADYRVMGF